MKMEGLPSSTAAAQKDCDACDSASPDSRAPRTSAHETVAPQPEPSQALKRLPLRDRRKGPRREPKPDRASEFAEQSLAANDLLPRNWTYLIAGMLASIGAAFILSGGLPRSSTIFLLSVSLLLVVVCGSWFSGAALPDRKSRILALSLTVILPPFMFGLGMMRWALADGLPYDAALATLLCVGGITSTLMRRHPVTILSAQLSIWSAAVVANGSLAGLSALLVALSVAAVVGREEVERMREEERLRIAQEQAQARSRVILTDYEETRQGWFWETDRRSLLTYVSAPVAQALGAEPEELIGQPLVTLFSAEHDGEQGVRALKLHLSRREPFHEISLAAALEDAELWWALSGRPTFGEGGEFLGYRGSGTDLTERRRSQERAARLAHFDSLTELANRFQMTQRLDEILTSPLLDKRSCAVLLLDLDRFKQVNDTMGHPAGDALLRKVARRLDAAVGKAGLVGRLGGDEFEVIIPGRSSRQALAELSLTIIDDLSQPYTIDGQNVNIGVSIGLALAPHDGVTNDDLIRNADLALYAAKDAGRGRYEFFSEELHAEAKARARLEIDLREAIAAGDLQLFYQPVIALGSERISSFEALLRWHHRDKGWMPTHKFIETAEYTGLISVIGEWALRTACMQMAQWPDTVSVSVNVSPLQFANPQLPSIVTSAIASAGIDPARLELEITESVYLNDDAGTDEMFARLKAIGVRLALDDFGTGYSSLGYLKKAPFDRIKIDQSFVRGAAEKVSRNRAIIASIANLAQALGMDTTAEGVETLDELDLVRSLGCSHIQGFIYERPMEASAATARIHGGLEALPVGQREARAPRESTMRQVVLEHEGHSYAGTLRNISATGAMIEGLWNVPVGARFIVHLSQTHKVEGVTRWSTGDRMGLAFADALGLDWDGRIVALQGPPPKPEKFFANRLSAGVSGGGR